jgi:hypothetical protein
MTSSNILYFGDQTVDTGPFLHDLFRKSSTSPALKRFLDDSTSALRLEISNLPAHDQQALPVFRTIQELLENGCETNNQVVLSTIRLCIAQLGDYIL